MGKLLEEIIESALQELPELHTRILADEVVSLRDELATAREIIQESMEARRVTEAEGGSLNQANNEIDRLRARVAELEKQPRANELRALRNLFAAAGRTIHTASAGGRATLEEINDAWADVCATNVANRDLPAPDVVPVPMEEWTVAQILANAWSRHPLTCGERDKLVAEWDALRSGEAGKGGAT